MKVCYIRLHIWQMYFCRQLPHFNNSNPQIGLLVQAGLLASNSYVDHHARYVLAHSFTYHCVIENPNQSSCKAFCLLSIFDSSQDLSGILKICSWFWCWHCYSYIWQPTVFIFSTLSSPESLLKFNSIKTGCWYIWIKTQTLYTNTPFIHYTNDSICLMHDSAGSTLKNLISMDLQSFMFRDGKI